MICLGTLKLKPRHLAVELCGARPEPGEEAIMLGLVFKPLSMLATGNVRGLVSFFLGLALLGALWETSLVNLSSRPTATTLMTEVGVEVINPILVHNSFGLSLSLYRTLEQQASAHPSQPISVPGINAQKVVVLGSDIQGKTFNDGMRVIYGKVADAYYDSNGTGVFSVPQQVSQIVSAISLLPQAVANQATQAAGAPQPPSVPLPPVSAIGLSLSTLTAQGHAQVRSLDYWFLGAAGILALFLALFGRRWGRLTNVAWAVFSSTIPGLFGIGAIWFFRARNPAIFQPYDGLLSAIGSAFVPVYVGAAAAAVAALILARVGDFAGRLLAVGGRAEPRAGERAALSGFGAAKGHAQPNAGYGAPAYRRPTPPQPQPAPQAPYGSPLDPTQPYMPQSGRGAWPPASSNPQWTPSSAGSEPLWPPSSPADAPWPQQQPAWDQPQRSGPVGPTGPAYGRPVPSEQPWPPQGPASPYGQSSYGQGTRNTPNTPAGQGWPPQDDEADPWTPRRG
jgi:hypothetical protein